MQNYQIPPTCQVRGLNDIYLKYFGYISNGIFVDAGAYDGIQHSNTWGLAMAGWKGICYEPVPEHFISCSINHRAHDVKVINSCVGNIEGEITFNVAGTLSTYVQNYLHSEYWKHEYSSAYPIKSSITTLDKSLKKNDFSPEFHVLSIDVEGAESDVLKGFDINYWKPKMALVEAQELHPAKELSLQATFINEYFDKAGYSKIYCDDINSIYVRV